MPNTPVCERCAGCGKPVPYKPQPSRSMERCRLTQAGWVPGCSTDWLCPECYTAWQEQYFEMEEAHRREMERLCFEEDTRGNADA